MKKFSVHVAAGSHPLFSVVVEARDEWQARTRAMITYPHPLRGEKAVFYVGEAA